MFWKRLFVIVVPLTIAACGPGKPKGPFTPKIDETPVKAVTSTGITMNWVEPLPDGTVGKVMEIVAKSGKLTNQKGFGAKSKKLTQTGMLKDADGDLYRDNLLKAKFHAPEVRASEDNRTVIGMGRVKIESVDPPGITVTADRVAWRYDMNEIVAFGNVFMVYKRPGEAEPQATGGPFKRLTIDTALQEFHIP